MNNWKEKKIIHRVKDDSYVIDYNGMPYHVPDNDEFHKLYLEVKEYALANPGQVEDELPPPEPTEEELLASAKASKLAEIDAALAENDRKLVRPLANGETKVVDFINDAQATNRSRRAMVVNCVTIAQVNSVQPVFVDLSKLAG